MMGLERCSNVRDHFAKRNHYNPCSWTALWNRGYFDALRGGTATSLRARNQTVFALNLRADSIYQTTVGNVHYDKGLGWAKITPEEMKEFCRRRFPDKYESMAAHVRENPETLFMDFEETLEAIEAKGGYDSLLEVARLGELSSIEHKGFVTCLLIIHALRSHEMMNSMIDFTGFAGIPKWEYFWMLKNALASPIVLARAVTPLALGQWTFYRTPEHRFPLCDSPVMIGSDILMAVLSPRLILEIDLNVPSAEEDWTVRDGIETGKYEQFRLKAINNAFKEIIFSDAEELERWRLLLEYQARIAVLQNPDTRPQAVAMAANRVIWAVQGFGRVSQEFDEWVKHKFNI
jgi:hypothetical protein